MWFVKIPCFKPVLNLTVTGTSSIRRIPRSTLTMRPLDSGSADPAPFFCKSYQQTFFCEEYYITYAVEHQVDRAAHIQINKIDIQFLIDNFAGFDNMVHLGTADLDTKDIFRNVAFGQCPLGLLTLLHSTVSKSKRDQHCYNRHSPATSYEPWPFHRT